VEVAAYGDAFTLWAHIPVSVENCAEVFIVFQLPFRVYFVVFNPGPTVFTSVPALGLALTFFGIFVLWSPLLLFYEGGRKSCVEGSVLDDLFPHV